jgi:sugar phosphate permease
MKMEGLAGLHGWQWLFLLEGILPVLLGIAILIFPLLPDKPAAASWLTPDQRRWLQEQLSKDDAHPQANHVADLLAAITDKRLWLLSATNFMLVSGLYGFIYWAPSIVKLMSGATDARVGLLSGIPYALAAVTMVIIAIRADRARRPRLYGAACALLGSIGMVAICLVLNFAPTVSWGLPALCLAAVGIYGALAPFWTLPTAYLKGNAAAGGIAIVNCFSALAGAVAPALIGWTKESTGKFTAGLLYLAAALAAGAVLFAIVPHQEDRYRV